MALAATIAALPSAALAAGAESLAEMFPQLPRSTVLDVLQSVGGRENEALEHLLALCAVAPVQTPQNVSAPVTPSCTVAKVLQARVTFKAQALALTLLTWRCVPD